MSEKTLLVASTGGHLEELSRLSRRFEPALGEVEWATFDDEQSRSLLAGQRVHHVEYVGPRGYGAAARNFRTAVRIVRRGRYKQVISTGAGIAVPFLLAARLTGRQSHYIESAARSIGPSLTGRVVSALPGVRLYTQYEAWATRRWSYAGSLFDSYRARTRPDPPDRARRVVVTLGTMRSYDFGRAVRRIHAILPEVVQPGAEVLWQTGFTGVTDLGIEARALVPAHELHEAIAGADLVIAHAGVGSVLSALDRGHCPVILPRLAEQREHVDDHQLLIARELADRELAVHRDPDELVSDDLRLALTRAVAADRAGAAFPLRTERPEKGPNDS